MNSPVLGGFAGLFGTAIGAVVRSRPELGLSFAAYTALLSGGTYLAENWLEGRAAHAYYESKGIQVPKRRYVERLFDLDYDNVILVGGLVGVLVASARQRPWAMRAGFSRFGGAFCFGAMGANLALKVTPFPGYRAALEQTVQQQMAARMHDADVERAMNVNLQGIRRFSGGQTIEEVYGSKSGTAPQHDSQAGSQPLWSTEEMEDYLAQGEEREKIDRDDPGPHLSRMIEDGEREWVPKSNYEWTPGSDGAQVLHKHIQELKQQRLELSAEAELYWHQIAQKEAEFYDTSKSRDPNGKQEKRAELEIMENLHVNVWLHISSLDWMIAASEKNLLQLKAMNENPRSHWIPPPPTKVAGRQTKFTRRLLEEISLLNQEEGQAAREAADAARGAADATRDGAHAGILDPNDLLAKNALFKKLGNQAEEFARRAEMKQKAIDKLLNDCESRIDDTRR